MSHGGANGELAHSALGLRWREETLYNTSIIKSDIRSRMADRGRGAFGSNVTWTWPIPTEESSAFPSGTTMGKCAERATGQGHREPTSSLLSLLQLLPVAWRALALQLHGLHYAL